MPPQVLAWVVFRSQPCTFRALLRHTTNSKETLVNYFRNFFGEILSQIVRNMGAASDRWIPSIVGDSVDGACRHAAWWEWLYGLP
jgi:hypothetical protein